LVMYMEAVTKPVDDGRLQGVSLGRGETGGGKKNSLGYNVVGWLVKRKGKKKGESMGGPSKHRNIKKNERKKNEGGGKSRR